MARTTASDVTELFDTDLDASAGGTVDAWIDAATLIVDDIAAAKPSTPAAKLEKIELFLTAGMMEAQDPRIESGERQSASVDYGERQSYMELAKMLDPTNTIANLDKPTATISVPDARGIDR